MGFVTLLGSISLADILMRNAAIPDGLIAATRPTLFFCRHFVRRGFG